VYAKRTNNTSKPMEVNEHKNQEISNIRILRFVMRSTSKISVVCGDSGVVCLDAGLSVGWIVPYVEADDDDWDVSSRDALAIFWAKTLLGKVYEQGVCLPLLANKYRLLTSFKNSTEKMVDTIVIHEDTRQGRKYGYSMVLLERQSSVLKSYTDPGS
jgi:hypothetical protein